MAVRPRVFADVPALILIDKLNTSNMAQVIQATYYRIATCEWGQEPSPDSPYLVQSQAELPDDTARQTNLDGATAFIHGLRCAVVEAGGSLDGEWFVQVMRDCLSAIEGQPVLISTHVERELHLAWAVNRVRKDPRHKNLHPGFTNLPVAVKQYDRRIARALWNQVEQQLEDMTNASS